MRIRPYLAVAFGPCMLWCLPACTSDVKESAAVSSQRPVLQKPREKAEPAEATAETSTPDAARESEESRPIKGIEWAKSYTEAVDQARDAKKLIMVDFYTDW